MIPSHFNSSTTAEEAASYYASQIHGKVVLITGASPKGLGAESARVIAKYGASLVILAGRNVSKLETTVKMIKAETPFANIRILQMDLNSIQSVKKAADKVNHYSETIDVLINNAGIIASDFQLSPDGFESTLATNHIGPFLFTNLILNQMSRPTSRIVNVASWAHGVHGEIDFDNLEFSKKEGGKGYNKWTAYGRTKVANMLFTIELVNKVKVAAEAEQSGKKIEVLMLDPGSILTPMADTVTREDRILFGMEDEEGNQLKEIDNLKTLEEGSSTHIVTAFEPSLRDTPGAYLSHCQVANEMVQPYAIDTGNAQKLWEITNQMLGTHF